MDFKTSKKYYNLCNPYEPLEPDDERNVNLDAFGEDKGVLVRGFNWADKLEREITLADQPVFKLFTGHRGSGKTTELKRLAEQLSNQDGPNLFPVLIDAEDVIDLNSPIDVTDIISAVVYSTERAIVEKEGGSVDKAMNKGYMRRLWDWLCNTDIEIGKGNFTIPAAGKLIVELKNRPNLRQRIHDTVANHFSEFISEAKDELKMLNSRVQQKFGQTGIVIVFDSLEKLRGLKSNWHQVLESAEQVFVGNKDHIRLPVHVLYTVPVAITTRSIEIVDFLPMIKLRERNDELYEPGIQAARELIRQRVPDNILKELLGSKMEERIHQLILQSGGYPREIIQMLQQAIVSTEHPLSEKGFEHIIKYIAGRYRMVVPEEAFSWLAKVAVSKFLTIDDMYRQIVDQMLLNHIVLSYLDDEPWFALHPSVYRIPGVQKAIHDCHA